MTDKALPDELETVAAACLTTLRHTPAALITDIDGTISAIAPTPLQAVVDPVAREALERLGSRLDVVAVVSGRTPAVGAAMVGLAGLIYIGNHGLERIVRGETWTHPEAEPARLGIADTLAEIEAAVLAVGEAPWLLLENKGVTATVHYRLAPDPDAAFALLEPLARLAAERRGLRILPGRMIVELRPGLAVNKGTAIKDLAHELGLRGIVFFGDDVTDVDAFRALRELREAGTATTLRVGVVGAETPEIVITETDLTVPGVAACAATRLAVAARLEEEAAATAAADEAIQ